MQLAIASPPWRHNSGGIRVLHYLGYLATKLGHTVTMGHDKTNPAWGHYSEIIFRPDLVIVPEIHDATPNVRIPTIRWCLFYPGHLRGPVKYPRHEQVVCFDSEYLEACKAATDGPVWEFFLPSCDLPGLNEAPVPERDLPGSFWVHKGTRSDAGLPKQGLIEITDKYPATRRELVALLRRCETFVSYDKHSALIQEAFLCGVPEVIYYDKGWQEFMDWENCLRFLTDEPRDLKRVDEFLQKCRKLL